MESRPLDPGTREADHAEQHPDRDSVAGDDQLDVQRRVPFAHACGRDITLDVFTPCRLPDHHRPAIVLLHGGSWWKGGPSQFHHHAKRLARTYGFFAVSVDYRLSNEAPYPAALDDARAAVRWVRSQCESMRIDPTRIAIAGGSAGAHLASMILTGAGPHADEACRVNLGVLFNGEFDMWDLVEKGSLIEPMRQFMAGTPEEVPQRYDELSSIQHVHADMPPTLLLHGTADLCVSHEQSVAFAERLRSVGVHAEVELYEDQPHAWFNREPGLSDTMARMERFLAEQFRL